MNRFMTKRSILGQTGHTCELPRVRSALSLYFKPETLFNNTADRNECYKTKTKSESVFLFIYL